MESTAPAVATTFRKIRDAALKPKRNTNQRNELKVLNIGLHFIFPVEPRCGGSAFASRHRHINNRNSKINITNSVSIHNQM